jgi:hypothetical protein
MLIDCHQMSFYRKSCGLGPFIDLYRSIYPSISSLKLFSLFLNDKVPSSMKKKAMDLHYMKIGWHSLMQIPI